MAGIYIHIPFCRQACTYCNFHFSTSLKLKEEMVDSIIKEIHLTPLYNEEINTIETIYFGGGTPGILNVDEVEKIINTLKNKFNIIPNAEITLETNPDDINPQKLTGWKNAGVNRLSVGIQSFNDAELKWMNRAHNAAKALECLEQIKNAGFTNYSADLIYGSPLQTDEILQKNINLMLAQKPPHLSCYALTVEDKTVLKNKIVKKEEPNVDEEVQASQFELLVKTLTSAGYEQYEISNFALPHYRSRHNSNYWKGVPYYGFGPAAHSFNGYNERSWNVANNSLYIKSLQQDHIPKEIETLTTTQMKNEVIMTELRTCEGIDLKKFIDRYEEISAKQLTMKATKFIKENVLEIDNNFLKLTPKGKFLADGIAADLFF